MVMVMQKQSKVCQSLMSLRLVVITRLLSANTIWAIHQECQFLLPVFPQFVCTKHSGHSVLSFACEEVSRTEWLHAFVCARLQSCLHFHYQAETEKQRGRRQGSRGSSQLLIELIRLNRASKAQSMCWVAN